MTVQDAIDKLEKINNDVQSNTVQDSKESSYINNTLDLIIQNLKYIAEDPVLGGGDLQVSDALANHITSVTQAILGSVNVDGDWVKQLLDNYTAYEKAIRPNFSDAREKLRSSSEKYERWKKLSIAILVAFIVVGFTTILLVVLQPYIKLSEKLVEKIASICGLIDFSMGGISFIVERLSDHKVRRISKETKDTVTKDVRGAISNLAVYSPGTTQVIEIPSNGSISDANNTAVKSPNSYQIIKVQRDADEISKNTKDTVTKDLQGTISNAVKDSPDGTQVIEIPSNGSISDANNTAVSSAKNYMDNSDGGHQSIKIIISE